MEIAPVLKDYFTYLDTIRGKSHGTVHEYMLDLTVFLRYMKQMKNAADPNTPFDEISIDDIDIEFIKTITLSDIYSYLNYMSRGRDTVSATRARKVSALRGYFKYLTVHAHLLEHNPCETLETPKKRASLPRFLTLDQSVTLLQNIQGKNAERDYAIILLFLTCGLRLSELCGLNITDIHEDGTMRVLGKGNKERTVYINDACREALSAYLKKRAAGSVKPSDKNALFISRLGKRMGTRSVQNLVEKAFADAGFSGLNLTTHKLRHTAATIMFRDGGVDLRTLQEILGHAQLNTTQIYTHVSNEQMQNAAEQNPLAHIKPKQK